MITRITWMITRITWMITMINVMIYTIIIMITIIMMVTMITMVTMRSTMINMITSDYHDDDHGYRNRTNQFYILLKVLTPKWGMMDATGTFSLPRSACSFRNFLRANCCFAYKDATIIQSWQVFSLKCNRWCNR